MANFYLLYSTWASNNACLATSSDGLVWIKSSRNPLWANSNNISMGFDSSRGIFHIFDTPADGSSLRYRQGNADLSSITPPVELLTGNFVRSSILAIGSDLHLWVTRDAPVPSRIGYFTCPDGVNWTDRGNIASLEGYANSSVIWNSTLSKFQMWARVPNQYTIAYTESANGTTWSTPEIVYQRKAGTWTANGVDTGTVILVEDTYHMWMCAQGPEPALGGAIRWAIGKATSNDGKVWVEYAANPVIKYGTAGYDNFGVIYPSTVMLVEIASQPTGLNIGSITNASAVATWTANPASEEVTAYGVYLNGSHVIDVAGISYTYTGLAASTTYTAGITSINAGGESVMTTRTFNTTGGGGGVPSQVQGMSITGVGRSNFDIRWNANPGGEGITKYVIHVRG